MSRKIPPFKKPAKVSTELVVHDVKAPNLDVNQMSIPFQMLMTTTPIERNGLWTFKKPFYIKTSELVGKEFICRDIGDVAVKLHGHHSIVRWTMRSTPADGRGMYVFIRTDFPDSPCISFRPRQIDELRGWLIEHLNFYAVLENLKSVPLAKFMHSESNKWNE